MRLKAYNIMEPVIIESKKELLKVSFKQIDQGFITLLKDELWEDKATEIAGFKITHPEVGELVFTLRTKGKEAKKVWNEAVKRLEAKLKKFGSDASKI
jgi:DNA-directed RNA polymerase subunit L